MKSTALRSWIRYALFACVLFACAPGATEFINKLLIAGLNCKARITVPENVREGDVIDVDVKLYNCIEAEIENPQSE